MEIICHPSHNNVSLGGIKPGVLTMLATFLKFVRKNFSLHAYLLLPYKTEDKVLVGLWGLQLTLNLDFWHEVAHNAHAS